MRRQADREPRAVPPTTITAGPGLVTRGGAGMQPEVEVMTASLAAAGPWSGIWAGFAVSIGTAMLLLLLVTAVGLSAVNPTDASSWRHVGTASAVWMGIALLVAMFIGGCTAGAIPARGGRYSASKGVSLWGLITCTVLASALWMAANTARVAAAASATLGPVVATAANTPVPSASNNVSANDVSTMASRNGVQIGSDGAIRVADRLNSGDRTGAITEFSRDTGVPPTRVTTLLNQLPGEGAPSVLTQGNMESAASKATVVSRKAAWGGFIFSLIALGVCVIGTGLGAGLWGREFPLRRRAKAA